MAAQLKLLGGTLTLPAAIIGDEEVNSASPLGMTKTRHLHAKGTNFGLALSGTPVTRTELLYVASAAGVIREFFALLADDGSSTSITVDLQKNGVTVLSAPISLTHSTGNGVAVYGTISVPTYVAGDRFMVVMTVSSATGAQGPFAKALADELSI